jgi:hypothetical protein
MENFYDDELRNLYRKKKIKKVKKSNHKHNYTDILIISYFEFNGEKREHISLGKRCIFCGKQKKELMFITERVGEGYRIILEAKQILDKYPELDLYDEKGNKLDRH